MVMLQSFLMTNRDRVATAAWVPSELAWVWRDCDWPMNVPNRGPIRAKADCEREMRAHLGLGVEVEKAGGVLAGKDGE